MNGLPSTLRENLAGTGDLSTSKLDALENVSLHAGESYVAAAIRAGVVSEEKLLETLAKSLHLGYTRLGDLAIDESVRSRVPTKVVFQYDVMPTRWENGSLTVATNDPFNLAMIECLRMLTQSRIQLVLSPLSDIRNAMKRHYGVGADTLDQLLQKNVLDLDNAAPLPEKSDVASNDQEASVVKFVNQIIAEAYKERATDIHIEPMEEDLRIRYRVDGVLQQVPDSSAISCIPGKELLSKDVKSARSSELESKTKIFVMLVPYYMNENYPG